MKKYTSSRINLIIPLIYGLLALTAFITIGKKEDTKTTFKEEKSGVNVFLEMVEKQNLH